MRDGGINLRGAYVSMSQQLADRLNSYALRQGDRRGEGMAHRMRRRIERKSGVSGNMA